MEPTDYRKPSDETQPLYSGPTTYGSSGRRVWKCESCSDQAGWTLVLPEDLEAHYQGHVRGYAEWLADHR